jgi:hypothetical protein
LVKKTEGILGVKFHFPRNTNPAITPSIPNYLSVLIGTQILRNL